MSARATTWRSSTAVGAAAYTLAFPVPPFAVLAGVTLLSLGYDLTQPLLGGIVADLPGTRRQAMRFNLFAIFTGFGLSSHDCQAALAGFTLALGNVAVGALVAAASHPPVLPRTDPTAERMEATR